jgi:4-aminobutyrate aminotransferase-like enzyme
VLRLAPPLSIRASEVDELAVIVADVVRDLQGSLPAQPASAGR